MYYLNRKTKIISHSPPRVLSVQETRRWSYPTNRILAWRHEGSCSNTPARPQDRDPGTLAWEVSATPLDQLTVRLGFTLIYIFCNKFTFSVTSLFHAKIRIWIYCLQCQKGFLDSLFWNTFYETEQSQYILWECAQLWFAGHSQYTREEALLSKERSGCTGCDQFVNGSLRCQGFWANLV